MYYPISCTRCGHDLASTPDPVTAHPNDWDALSCTECGEFHATLGAWERQQTPDRLRFLNKSRSLMLAMRREHDASIGQQRAREERVA